MLTSQLNNYNWNVNIQSPVITWTGLTYKISLTAVTTGSLVGDGAIEVFGELEYFSFDADASNTIIAL